MTDETKVPPHMQCECAGWAGMDPMLEGVHHSNCQHHVASLQAWAAKHRKLEAKNAEAREAELAAMAADRDSQSRVCQREIAKCDELVRQRDAAMAENAKLMSALRDSTEQWAVELAVPYDEFDAWVDAQIKEATDD